MRDITEVAIRRGEKTLTGSSTQDRKSMPAGLILNLLPGAGVIYAGNTVIGFFYIVVFLVSVYAYAPLAAAVVLVTYIHTAAAISERNTRIKESLGTSEVLVPPPSAFQLKATQPDLGSQVASCDSCGAEVSQTARYCKTCGLMLDKTRGSDSTPVAGPVSSCPNCGGNVSQGAKYCKLCGQSLDRTRIW